MMLSTIVRVSVLFHACYSTAALKLQTVVSSADGLAYDDSSRLKTQWILYTHGCEAHIDNNHLLRHSSLIMVSEMSADFAQSFIDRETMSQCLAVRLVKGMAKSLIKSPLTGDISNDEEDTSEWISRMLGVEMGWISYWPNDCTLFWINHRGEKAQITVLQPGEKNTFWTHSFMSHEFEIYDNGTGELVSRYIAEYDSFHVVGNHVLSPMEYDDPQKQIEKELKSVYFEPKAIKRTFSELGFKKGKLPPDVWSSISAYYYNNRNHMTFEEQAGASVFINWWESPCYFIGMPWGLKGRWQARLQKLVQNWIGHETPLEQTDIYGIRRYEQGARLLSHVDRITTHAVSLIINVAQENMKEPWMVEIYDFAGRLHEIEMQPGDTIYYESARCLHGRMRPLNGSHYVNIFAHYRPVGDPKWYTRPNPAGTPDPLLDVGECSTDGVTATCSKADLPTLSPSLEILQTSADLYRWWLKVSPHADEGSISSRKQVQDL